MGAEVAAMCSREAAGRQRAPAPAPAHFLIVGVGVGQILKTKESTWLLL